jgi:inorganic pyrophosphatase
MSGVRWRVGVVAMLVVGGLVAAPAGAADGDLVWAHRLGGTSSDIGNGVAVDGSGNVYVTGYFLGTADFDPDPVATYPLTSAGGHDGFVVKLDPAGDFEWVAQLGGTGSDLGFGVAVDGSGNVYVTGYFWETADFDPDPVATFELTSAGDGDGFVVKLDAAGDFEWAARMGGTSDDIGYGVAVDGSGNVHVTGYFLGTADFDPDPVDTFELTSAGGADGFAVKLDSAGGFEWAARWGGTGFDEGRGVAVDGSGNVHVTGRFEGTADFDPDPVDTYPLTSAGSADGFVVKLDSAGGFEWAARIGGTSGDVGRGVALDGSGNVHVTGYFSGTADFDPDPVDTYPLTSAGSGDGFVVKLDSAGDFEWAARIGGTSGDFGFGVAVDGSGNVHVTGYFSGTVDFDPDPADTFELTSAGSDDVFVVRLDPSGGLAKAVRLGGTGSDVGFGVAVDGSGSPHVTGGFRETVDFDPGSGVFELTSAGFDDGFVLRLYGPPLCRGVPATLVGTSGAEVLVGTSGDDVIVGLGGDDTISGKGGNDLICAGDGADTVYGGQGADRIYGQGGADTIYGGSGGDRLFGGKGKDLIYGQRGHDDLYGGAGNDRLFGAKGNDLLRGQGGKRDRLDGGPGTDELHGGKGSDDHCTRGEIYQSCEVIH